MKVKLISLLLLCLLLLTGCAHQLPTPDLPPAPPVQDDTQVEDTVPVPKVYTPAELLRLSGAEIVAIYGEDYTTVTPEGDPPYFYYENLGHAPYRFIGKPDDTRIQAVASDVVGSEMLGVICVGDSYADLEAEATALESYEFRAPANWYDDGFGVYGWAHVMGQTEQYVCYIMNEVLVSYECRAMD